MCVSGYDRLRIGRLASLPLFLLAMTAALIGGCSPPAGQETNDSSKASAPPAVSSPTTPGVPTAIEDVGHYGENIYDMAKAEDWANAVSDLTSLKQAAGQLSADVTSKGTEQDRLNAAIEALDRAVTAKDRTAATREANQITWIGADLAAPFKPPVPVEVTRLDYYGRELEIWSAQKDEVRLKTTASEMRRTWNALRPAVEIHGGGSEAEKFGKLIAQVEAARSVADFGRLATPILDEVDNLEKVFTGK